MENNKTLEYMLNLADKMQDKTPKEIENLLKQAIDKLPITA